MIYELRMYYANPGKLRPMSDRFRDSLMGYFDRHGFRVVGFWTDDVGEEFDKLTYLLAWDDYAARDKAWAAFRGDAEVRAAIAAGDRDGPLVARIENRILRPTPYSPLQ